MQIGFLDVVAVVQLHDHLMNPMQLSQTKGISNVLISKQMCQIDSNNDLQLVAGMLVVVMKLDLYLNEVEQNLLKLVLSLPYHHYFQVQVQVRVQILLFPIYFEIICVSLCVNTMKICTEKTPLQSTT